MSEIRQCWAYNVAGQRCDMPAGHPGDHGIQFTWTDDDCYNPILSAGESRPSPAKPAAIVTLPTVPTQPTVIKCVACQHQHKNGECKCGCYEFIG